jgi:hypothetical protein
MPITFASWVHGTAIQIEAMDKVEQVLRRGFNVRLFLKPGVDMWFHFPIPTPVILNDRRLRADSAMIDFKTDGGQTQISKVHVYDGAARIATHEGLNLSNHHPLERFAVTDRPEIVRGIAISVAVDMGVDGRWIEFTSAGVDFLS